VRRRAAAEHGNALVTALLLMMVMLTVGLATLAQVDTQQEQSGVERVRETTFNLGEGVLNAQIFALSQRWPGPGAGAGTPAVAPYVFGPCTEASDPLTQPNCPRPDTIRSLFTSPDTEASTTWRTEVRDNATTVPTTCASTTSTSSTFYSDASTAGQPPYDCNGDGRLWARAQATIRGRTRAIVALVQVERQTYQLPRSVLLAGRLEIGNSGNKGIIDARGDTALTSEILLRCTPTDLTTCAGHPGLLETLWSEGSQYKLITQLNGTKPQTAYTAAPALSAEALARLKQTAITNGTYFETCPTSESALAGAVVYVETCNQIYSSNAVINSPQSPGALIVADGSMKFAGRTVFHGLIYHMNKSNSPDVLVELSGNNGGVSGGVYVEGEGTFKINGTAFLTVDGRAFNAVGSYGSAGIMQNTWREIPVAAPGGDQATW